MRIAIASKFFYRRGGAEVHAIDLENALRRQGHETAVITTSHPENIRPTAHFYEVPSVEPFGTVRQKIKSSLRMLGGWGARERAVELLEDFKPDVVHLHNVHSYLSPVIAVEAKRRGMRVVWTLHDYKLVCPAYSFMNHGKICDRKSGGKGCVLRNRCIRGNFIASAGAWFESMKWNHERVAELTDCFICPSDFMREKMKQGGFPESKLNVLPNFYSGVGVANNEPLGKEERKGVVYIGRLSYEKGIDVLLEAAKDAEWELSVIGSGEMEMEMRRKFSDYPNIKFKGKRSKDSVLECIGKAKLLVVPSVCFENSPLALIEALSCGTPVAGSKTGGIPELIQPSCGEVFEADNPESLRRAVDRALSKTFDYNVIVSRARQKFSEVNYIENLLRIYRSQ